MSPTENEATNDLLVEILKELVDQKKQKPQRWINLSAVLTTAMATLLSALVVSFFALVWQGVNTVDDRINANNNELKTTIDVVDKSIKTLAPKVESNSKTLDEILKILKESSSDVAIKPSIEVPPNTPLLPEEYAIRDMIQQKIEQKKSFNK